MLKQTFANYRVPFEAVVIVAVLVVIRAVLWWIGITGMTMSPLASSIIAGGVFVMGLVVAGTLSDYKDAERAPTDLASGLYAILREAESMAATWHKPDMDALRRRLVQVVVSLRADINAGDTRSCQAAVEDLSASFLELEESDVPANYVVRLRQEQAGLRKAVLRIYHIQREEFLPSAKAMIVSIVLVILAVLLFTDMGGLVESLVTLAFLSFFFLALLRLLNVIDKPFKAGFERSDDDVSLFLLNELLVQIEASGGAAVGADEVEARAEQVEELLADAEHREAMESAAYLETIDLDAPPAPAEVDERR
jgi:hypothetical protein